jgi:tripartite-type tricarboxylate transporter receptor subunit TctC
MKALLHFSLAAVLICCWTPLAFGQPFPNKPVTVVVASAPGGVTDVVGRALAQRLSSKWRQQVLVENRGGASHLLGAQQVARASPDGHSLLIAEAGTYVINPNIYSREKLGYDLETGLAHITGIVRIHHALIATPSLPASTLPELIALAKKDPNRITYGTAGVGSAPHLNMVLLENVAQVRLTAVHYRGATPALTDVMGGHTKTMLISVASAIGPAKSGNAKILAVGSQERLPGLADVPTASETLPGYGAGTWFGLSVTGGTPQAIVKQISTDVREAIQHEDIRDKLIRTQLYEPMISEPAEFVRFIISETDRWGRLIRDHQLKLAP